jgi:hypothetical protein
MVSVRTVACTDERRYDGDLCRVGIDQARRPGLRLSSTGYPG